MTSLALRSPAQVVSRNTTGTHYRWNADVRNTNAWCTIPGSPFARGLVLMPNHPEEEHVSVTFGPLELPLDVDTFTFLFDCRAETENGNILDFEITLLDASFAALCNSVTFLSYGERKCATLRFPAGTRIYLRFAVSFREFVDRAIYCYVDVRYALAYKRNELVEVFNVAGSDKGTEVSVRSGVPHCYAIDYYGLFESLRTDGFNLLEIGLDSSSPPTDAPSLRAWRKFFPNARLFGYDIEDFGFFQQPATEVFQGDQGSREDLTRFLEAHHWPQFRVVVDDGSHASSHQQISLATLFPHVEPGGVYVIEDLAWQPYPEEVTTLEVLQSLRDVGTLESPFIDVAEARYLQAAVSEVDIRKPNDSEFALIQKKSEEVGALA